MITALILSAFLLAADECEQTATCTDTVYELQIDGQTLGLAEDMTAEECSKLWAEIIDSLPFEANVECVKKEVTRQHL